MRRKFGSLSAVVLAALSLVLALGGLPASAAGTPQASIAAGLPASFTPNIVDGTDSSGNSYRVFDMTQVDNYIVVGGVFAQVTNHGSGTALNRTSIFAFDKATGAVSAGFAPVLSTNGVVNAVAPGPNHTVLIGGKFTTVNGANARNFAVLDINTGAKVVNAPVFNGAVQDISVFGNRVFVGGTFTTVGGAAHGGIATLDATTWAVDPYVSLKVSGHHNYGVGGHFGAQAPVGVSALDIASTPSGPQMVIIGNFTSVMDQTSTYSRDQVAKILLPSAGTVTVDPNWATAGYTPACKWQAFDSYIRSVQWDPTGSYFVITATGAPFSNTLCDTAARWNGSDTGSAVNPAWVASTGGDSLWSVAVTGSAVYVGGHERWLNNALGSDSPKPGAVPRPGMAALDPLSGVPLSWNPGRNPRGIGAGALLATADGLYVGMDTDYFGNFGIVNGNIQTGRHQKIGFFPLSGTALASQDTGSLPGNVYLAGRATATQTASIDAVVARSGYDPTTAAGSDSTMTGNGGVSWSKSRGAFMAGNKLFYGYPDGGGNYDLAWQTFDGSTFGPQTLLTAPYHDPVWMNVATGSGPTSPVQTYDGVLPNFYGSELKAVTGMFYWNGRLYYTKANLDKNGNRTTGIPGLFYRNFSVDSGIVGPTSTQVVSSGFANAGGFMLNGGMLYMADRTTGNLLSMSFVNGVPGTTQTPVSGPNLADHRDWRTQSLFILPSPTAPNQPPVASFTASCPNQTCTFDGSASSDPDGNVPLSYSWDFGDNSQPGSGAIVNHTYASSGTVTVKLTVTDTRSGTGSTSSSVTVPPNQTTPGIAIRGATGAPSQGSASMSLPYPAGIQAGDGLVLIVSTFSSTTADSTPGFTAVSTQTALSGTSVVMTTQVLQQVATGPLTGDLTIHFPGTPKVTAQMVAYSGTPLTGPVRLVQGSTVCSDTTHCATPTATGVVPNDWAMSVWSDKSQNGGTWTAPGSVTVRNSLTGTGTGGVMATLVADSGGPVATSSYGGLTATLDLPESKAILLTVVIAGS